MDTEPTPTATPTPPIPGERRLDRPPSDRYRTTEAQTGATPAVATDGDAAPRDPSLARGVVLAILTGILVGAIIVALGGIVLVSAGLVIVAAAGGWAIAVVLRSGAGRATTGAPSRTAMTWLSIALAVAAIALGQVGLWLYARTEGGVLPLGDYLAQTFGVLVPLQAIVAGLTAAWASR